MEKENKVINVLTTFYISHKSDVKTFLKWILNQCRTALVNIKIEESFLICFCNFIKIVSELVIMVARIH